MSAKNIHTPFFSPELTTVFFPDSGAQPITNEDETRQLKRLDQVRQDRDSDAVAAALAKLAAEAADPEVNLMPTLIEASSAYVSPTSSPPRPARA